METQKNNGMCRCCASEGTFKDVKSSYQWMGEEEIYADMLRECLDIALCADVTGEVEGGICEVCITQLRNASNFKKQVLHTEEQFKQRIQDKLFKNEIVKVELSPQHEEDSDNDNVLDNTLDDDYSGTEYEVPVKTEVDESKPKKRGKTVKASTSRAKKLKKEDGESSKRGRGKLTRKRRTLQTDIEDTTIKSEYCELPPENRGKKSNIDMAKCFYDLYKLRTAVREILSSSNATVLHGHSDKGYGCSFCGQYFLKPDDLKQHNLQLHSKNIKTFLKGKEHSKFFVKLDITDLLCNICNQSISNIEEVIDHLNSDHNKKIHVDVKKVIFPFKFHGNELRCSDCMELFYTFKALHEHMHSHYSNYICEVCSAGFVTKSSLLLHLTSHGTGSFQCSRCPKVFDTPQKKKNHEAKVHDEKAPKNVCRICNERFKEYYAKEKHIADVHGIKADYRCEECNKTYHCKAHLQGHIKKNHLMMRPHRCMECDMGFYTSNDLKKHMPKHTGSREFKCTVCSKTYARKTTMKQHMRTKHGVNE